LLTSYCSRIQITINTQLLAVISYEVAEGKNQTTHMGGITGMGGLIHSTGIYCSLTST